MELEGAHKGIQSNPLLDAEKQIQGCLGGEKKCNIHMGRPADPFESHLWVPEITEKLGQEEHRIVCVWLCVRERGGERSY